MRSAHMIPATMQWCALARRASPTLAQLPMSLAPVRSSFDSSLSLSLSFNCLSFSLSRITLDTCLVNNGGCDVNAICSHDSTTNAVKCYCKTGYSNTGSPTTVICTGKQHQLLQCLPQIPSCFSHPMFRRCLQSQQWWMRCECQLLARHQHQCSGV